MSELTSDGNTEAAIVDDAEFNAADADVCIISSDNIRFKVHSLNLRAHSSVFPVVQDATTNVDDPAHMTERAEVLRVIFKFIYPEPRLLKIGQLPFSTLEEVAIAAEKWQFIALSELCDRYMEDHAAAHPAKVFKYAFLRSEDAMLDRVAPHTISLETLQAARLFDPILFQRWILYREACVAFIGAYRETLKEVETKLKEWSRKNTTPLPPRFSLTSSLEEWENTCGTAANRISYVSDGTV